MTIGHKTIGQGPKKILFLHGWLSDYTIYDEIIPYFDTSKYTMTFVDYRGYGLSSQMQGDHSIEEVAMDVIHLAQDAISYDWPLYGGDGDAKNRMPATRRTDLWRGNHTCPGVRLTFGR